MVDGYAAGVNAWLKKIGGASKITDPSCRGAAYIKPERDRASTSGTASTSPT